MIGHFFLTLWIGMNKTKEIYAHDTIEFATVAVRFCQTLEQVRELSLRDFVGQMLKIVPLLYLKAQLLPFPESEGDMLPAPQVSEEDYNYVLMGVKQLLGDADEYLAVTDPEDLHTEDTKWQSVAEHLADAYQPVRNFLAVYQDGVEENMTDALWSLCEDFREYWGQAVVDALRVLHRINLKLDNDEEAYD